MKDTNPITDYLNDTGTSQTDFGRGLGVGQGIVYQWICGLRPVSVERALDIEEKYGIDAERLNPKVRLLTRRIENRLARRKAQEGEEVTA